MSGFTPQAFEKKLGELNSSQQSIQTLSLWLIHHRKHYKAIVQTWFKELKKASKSSRRLMFMYLANDVIQNSRKKGPEFCKEFYSVLKLSFQYISKDVDPNTLSSLERLIKIWEERNIYDKSSITAFKQALCRTDSTDGSKENSSDNSTNGNNKRANDDVNDDGRVNKKILADRLDSGTLNNILAKIGNLTNLLPLDSDRLTKVEPEKLIKSLKDLENSASADQDARQKIENFPSELFDPKLMENALSQESPERWTKLVEEAQSALTTYNRRLTQELEDRRQLASMLACFIEKQRRALSNAEQNLTEYRDKLRKVIAVREELKSHLQNLPDLSQLPSVSPLPSALDLFKLSHS